MKKMTTIILILLFSIRVTAPGFTALCIFQSHEEVNMLSWKNIDRYMSTIDIREPEIIKAQIRHETGNLTSRFCREQNNLCGMRLARSRETTAIGEGNHMAKYRSWQESLQDYKIWQDKYYPGGNYYNFLSKHGYATDPWYMFKLKRIAKNN
jgi:hypothetical protein